VQTKQKMKIIIPISLILIACNQAQHYNNKCFADTLTEVSTEINVKPNDSLLFSDFERQVKNEEYISLAVISKFVQLSSTTIYNTNSKFIGKGIYIKNEYLLFHIKEGTDAKGNELFITYTKNQKQIDGKSFLYYCHNCSTSELVAYPYFSDNKYNKIIVEYYEPTTSKAMPDSDEIKVLKKETWMINSKGFFILN
jgi:hypothetical protein